MPEFGTKKIPYLGISEPEFWNAFSYLSSAPSNLSYCKVWCKNKNS